MSGPAEGREAHHRHGWLRHPAWTGVGAIATILGSAVALVQLIGPADPGPRGGSGAPSSSAGGPAVTTEGGHSSPTDPQTYVESHATVAATDFGIDMDANEIVATLGPGEVELSVNGGPVPSELADAAASDVGLKALNHAGFAPWPSGTATLAGCRGLPGSAYAPSVPLASFDRPTTFCVLSSSRRFGFLETVRAEVDGNSHRPVAYLFDFVLWKRDGDP